MYSCISPAKNSGFPANKTCLVQTGFTPPTTKSTFTGASGGSAYFTFGD